jgi:DNA-binding GntR family transcriptional regulator
MDKSTPRFPEGAAAPAIDARPLAGGAALEPRPNTSRMIADALRLAIVEGALQPGMPLRQDAVARRFSVSAIPVREALRQLESEGWVKAEPNKGATVSPLVADEAREIYEMRAALESLAIGLAIAHHTPATLAAAATCLATAAAEADQALYVAHNQAFHVSLYLPAGRPRLLELIETLHKRGERYLRLKLDVPSRKADSDREHAALLKAVERRDVVAAQAMVSAHLLNSGELLHRFITQKQAAEAPPARTRRRRVTPAVAPATAVAAAGAGAPAAPAAPASLAAPSGPPAATGVKPATESSRP